MRSSASALIDILEDRQLLSPELIGELRRQITESTATFPAEVVAKLLVDNGQLSRFQATKLIEEVNGASGVSTAPPRREPELDLAVTDQSDDGVAEVYLEEDDDDAIIVDEVVEVGTDDEPVEIYSSESLSANHSSDLNSDEDVLEVTEVVEVVDAEEVTPSLSSSRRDTTPRGPRPKARVASKSNPWDSFRILGVAMILGLVLVTGFFLITHFFYGNADKLLADANSSYESRSYDSAAISYQKFVDNFPSHEKNSFAKVRAALAKIRQMSENAPDPKRGLETALEVVPSIAGEPGLSEQQSDLAGVLVGLAEKFTQRAEEKKETAERKELMASLAKLMELINNPQYVGGNQRAQLAPTLLRVEESQLRTLRDIGRDEELVATLAKIDSQLESNDTVLAYTTYREITQKYPQLEADQGLIDRVKRAAKIQETLVKPDSLSVELSEEALEVEPGRSFVLSNRSGAEATGLAGYILYMKAKGSIYALDGQTGNILWREYVGQGFTSQPVRVTDSPTSDVLVAKPEEGIVARLKAEDGSIVWQARLKEPVLTPVLEGQDVFVATYTGQLACLNVTGGQTKWSIRIPQKLSTAPGVGRGKDKLYIPGDHSNLYVIDREDGKCREVYYLAHLAGSITVPPVILLGELFIVDNFKSNAAKIRLLEVDEQGLNLKSSQIAIDLDGNVTTDPVIDSRRLIVQSDLGNAKVLDVDTSRESDRVSVLATVPKNHEPQASYMVAENNQLWIADSRLMRSDLVVASSKVNRLWIQNDGDQFVGPLQKLDDVLIHSRILRGNQGVRISAVKAENGNPIWQNDIGSPITLMGKSGERRIVAVNSSGAAFTLGATAIRNTADSDAGQGTTQVRLGDPLLLAGQQALLMNRSKPNQIVLVDLEKSLARSLNIGFGAAKPTTSPVVTGDLIVLGLDNGQMVAIDPRTGRIKGSPFQPAMAPNRTMTWNTPAYLESEKALIVANSENRLYKLAVGESISLLREVPLELSLTGAIVPIEGAVAAVASLNGSHQLQVFDSNTLDIKHSIPLASAAIAGPMVVDGKILIQTSTELLLISTDGKVEWKVAFSNSQLIGEPVIAGQNWILATKVGEVCVIASSTGNLLNRIDTRQPLSAAPVALPSAMLVGSDEGAVIALPISELTARTQP